MDGGGVLGQHGHQAGGVVREFSDPQHLDCLNWD
jgi:hypothetical protein